MTSEAPQSRGRFLDISWTAGRLVDRLLHLGPFHVPRLHDHHNGGGTLIAHPTVYFGVGVDIDTYASVTIRENVMVSDGVIIIRHNHTVWHVIPMKGRYETVSERPISLAQPLLIERCAFIGMRAIIMPQVRTIGEYAVVGAGAVVVDDVPARAIVVGNPAKIIKQWQPPGADSEG